MSIYYIKAKVKKNQTLYFNIILLMFTVD